MRQVVRALGVAALFLPLLCGVSACGSPASDAKGDTRAVYCLAPSRNAEFLRASVSLGVATADTQDPTRVVVVESGKAVNPAEMRGRYRDTFDRVCDAMMTADSVGASDGSGGESKGGGESWVTLLVLPVLLALLGAALSLLGQVSIKAMTRRDERLDSLRQALTDYENSAENYLEAWRDDPETSHEDIAVKRRELVGVMRLLPARGAPPAEIQRLSRALPLAAPLPARIGLDTTAPSRIPDDQRATIVQREQEALDTVIPLVGALGSAAWWRRRGGRG